MEIHKMENHNDIPNDHPLREIEGLSGKTVKSVEFGFCKERQDKHQSDYIIINCTDGDRVKLTIGTNLREFSLDGRLGIEEKQVLCDFNIEWLIPNTPEVQFYKSGHEKRKL